MPVHSCVLSAFSPFLCGALSAMPSPRNGQKRLIEVQSMESCTLLRLVSLLYSGQLHEDKGDVLSAACKLGISIPHRSTKRTSSEQNTQTDFTNTAVEKECQTETLSSENPVETVGASLWRSDQGLYTYTDGSDITLNVALQNVPGNPEGMPSLPVMDVVHESAMYPTVSGPACLPQVYVCPTAATSQPPAPQVQPSLPSNISYIDALVSQGESAGGEDCVLDAFARFENNIPGFINYFIDANISEQSQRGEIKSKGRGRRARGASGGFNVKGEKLSISRGQQHVGRSGRVARMVWIGQGGGRVGRVLGSRQVLKNQGRRTRQNTGAMKEEGGRGRSSSRARQRETGSRALEGQVGVKK